MKSISQNRDHRSIIQEPKTAPTDAGGKRERERERERAVDGASMISGPDCDAWWSAVSQEFKCFQARSMTGENISKHTKRFTSEGLVMRLVLLISSRLE